VGYGAAFPSPAADAADPSPLRGREAGVGWKRAPLVMSFARKLAEAGYVAFDEALA